MNRMSLCRSFPVILALSALLLSTPSARAEAVPRTCTVKEVVKGGMYVYLRCQEKGTDIWIAAVARAFRDNEEISFVDAPPMTNFYSKQLDRIFPEVIFTDILPPAGQRK